MKVNHRNTFNISEQAKLNENNLNAQSKAKTEGFISKKLLNIKWEGGRLADQLNTDHDLEGCAVKG